MDIVLEGPFCSLSQNDATVDLNENLNLLLMAMESYKVFSVLLGGEDNTEDDFYSIFGATESYENDNYDEYDAALESAESKLDEYDKAMLDQLERTKFGEIYDRAYKEYKEKLDYNKFYNYFLNQVINRSDAWKEKYADKNFKKSLNTRLKNEYDNRTDLKKKNTKPTDKTNQTIDTNGRVRVSKSSDKSVEDRAEKKFGEIVKEFFKKIGDWFKRIFGNEKGEVEDSEVVVVRGIDPDIINQKGLDILNEILNCNDEKVAREKLELLQSLVNSTRETVDDELAKVKASDKYTGVKKIFHAGSWFRKVNKLAHAEYKRSVLQNEALNEYQKLINVIADAIFEGKSLTKGSVKRKIKSSKKGLENELNKVAKANEKVNKASQKS